MSRFAATRLLGMISPHLIRSSGQSEILTID
jgi:hypothetical protein